MFYYILIFFEYSVTFVDYKDPGSQPVQAVPYFTFPSAMNNVYCTFLHKLHLPLLNHIPTKYSKRCEK
jgi:hypothetical protein